MRFKCTFDQTFKDQYKRLVAATFGCICLIRTVKPPSHPVETFRLNLNWGNNWARRRFSPNQFWLHFNDFHQQCENKCKTFSVQFPRIGFTMHFQMTCMAWEATQSKKTNNNFCKANKNNNNNSQTSISMGQF